ncbi:MAG: SPOR domain-containing protein, partial [Alistipes sp.]|nr:SPOR domain-containing protein [Alistipes sp.]
VSGFRIVIYSDNGQYAGDNAETVLKEFKTLYPRINAYLVYESPYFKVSVGDCLSMEEAQILMAKIVANYPKAFPRRESIALDALTAPLTAVVEPVDSLAIPIVVEE